MHRRIDLFFPIPSNHSQSNVRVSQGDWLEFLFYIPEYVESPKVTEYQTQIVHHNLIPYLGE